jgi:hypothetical protein
MKQEIDYADLADKNNIYDNPLQEIPETQVEDNIFEKSDIKQVIRLDLRQESLLDLFHTGITIILDNPPDTLNLFLIPIYIASSSKLFLFFFLGYINTIEPFEFKILQQVTNST